MTISGSGAAGNEQGRRPGRPTGRDCSKYDALLTSARKLFLSQSYQQVTTRELAAEAGVDMALIGYYFSSKEGLYQAMFREIYERALTQLRRRRKAPLPDSVSELFDMVYDVYGTHPELALLLFRTLVLKEGPSREFLLRDIVQQLRSYAVKVLESLKASGEIDSGYDLPMLEDAFAGLCFRPFQMRPLWVESMGVEEADRHIQRLFRQNAVLFERGIRPVQNV